MLSTQRYPSVNGGLSTVDERVNEVIGFIKPQGEPVDRSTLADALTCALKGMLFLIAVMTFGVVDADVEKNFA